MIKLENYEYRRSTLRILLIVTIFAASFFAVRNWSGGWHTYAIIEGVFALFWSGLLFISKNTPHLRRWSFVYLCSFYFIVLYGIFTSSFISGLYTWMFIFPILSYLLLGRRVGTLLTAISVFLGMASLANLINQGDSGIKWIAMGNFGFSIIALHGDLEQRDRDQALVRFATKSVSILVATDVASRGLDIDSLDAVINFNVAHDSEVHVHRVGRTGRAGSKGFACTLFDNKEAYQISLLEDRFGEITEETLPSEQVLNESPMLPPMACIRIDGGKKQKVRAGDILGALTGKEGIDGKSVGKIQLFDHCAYVAVEAKVAKAAVQKISKGKLKGRTFRAWIVRSYND